MSILTQVQNLGKALLLPIATLPIAGLLLRLGAGDILNQPILFQAGNAIFANLPLLFAIGVATGLSRNNDGAAALSGAVSYLILKGSLGIDKPFHLFSADTGYSVQEILKAHNLKALDMGVFAGIIAGIIGAHAYNKYYTKTLTPALGFFSGKRLAPIMAGLITVFVAAACLVVWPYIQVGISVLNDGIVQAGSVGLFIYAFVNRLLLGLGLHHVLNSFVWFQVGSFTDAHNVVTHGDLNRFFAGDKSAGYFMAGAFPIFMFGLPGAALGMYLRADPDKKKAAGGLLFSAALTAFLTGVTEPIEYTFMLLAPVLYGIHAVLMGISYAIAPMFEFKMGFGFSAGFLDAVLNWGISTNPWVLLVLGPVFFVLYTFIFYTLIPILDIPTPGRGSDEVESGSVAPASSNSDEDLVRLASTYIHAVGGLDNLSEIDNCITRLRLKVKDQGKVDVAMARKAGAMDVKQFEGDLVHIIVGVLSDRIAETMKSIQRGEVPLAESDLAKTELNSSVNSKADIPTAASSNIPAPETVVSGQSNAIKTVGAGIAKSLEEVPDDVFSKRMMGDGVAIATSDEYVKSPVSGEVVTVFPTGHAFIVKDKVSQADILVHIGVDTVNVASPEMFAIVNDTGAQVEAGDNMIKVNWNLVREQAKSDLVIVVNASPDKVVSNKQEGKNITENAHVFEVR